MKLVPFDSVILRAVSAKVEAHELDEIRGYYKAMSQLMRKLGGCGLAANQIGISKRFFVWGYGMVINPEILLKSIELEMGTEGCLSFPNQLVNKPRYKSITVEYLDERGVKLRKVLKGLPARIFSHELDHLDGICIV